MAEEVGDILSMLGGEEFRNVNYEAALIYPIGEVEPDSGDTLEQLLVKAQKWADIVRRGHSLAAAFGMLPRDGTEPNYEAIGRQAMTPKESAAYAMWRAGHKMPPMDKKQDSIPREPRDGTAATFADRTAALRILYADKEIGEGNTVWFHRTYGLLIPLVIAAVKVMKARKGLAGGTNQDPRRFQEQAAARRAIGVAGEITNKVMEAIKKVTRGIDDAMGPVHERAKAVAQSGTKAAVKKTTYNATAELLGGKTVGTPSTWAAGESKGRLERLGTLVANSTASAPGLRPSYGPAPKSKPTGAARKGEAGPSSKKRKMEDPKGKGREVDESGGRTAVDTARDFEAIMKSIGTGIEDVDEEME